MTPHTIRTPEQIAATSKLIADDHERRRLDYNLRKGSTVKDFHLDAPGERNRPNPLDNLSFTLDGDRVCVFDRKGFICSTTDFDTLKLLLAADAYPYDGPNEIQHTARGTIYPGHDEAALVFKQNLHVLSRAAKPSEAEVHAAATSLLADLGLG